MVIKVPDQSVCIFLDLSLLTRILCSVMWPRQTQLKCIVGRPLKTRRVRREGMYFDFERRLYVENP